jgi:hypothetical protein
MPLKNEAISRLQAISLRVSEFGIVKKYPILEKITQQQIQDNINYLQAKDQNNLWQDFLDFNLALDSTRNQNLFDVMPEFKKYV